MSGSVQISTVNGNPHLTIRIGHGAFAKDVSISADGAADLIPELLQSLIQVLPADRAAALKGAAVSELASTLADDDEAVRLASRLLAAPTAALEPAEAASTSDATVLLPPAALPHPGPLYATTTGPHTATDLPILVA